MKKTVLFLFSILLCAALRAQEQEFVIRGVIPGMADGIRVALLSAEGLSHETLAETEAKDGRFELRGKVDSPLLCTLVTNNLGILSEEEMNAGASIRWTYTTVFVDNVVMTVETPHYDSIPVELPVSASFRITGGEIQADFNEYNLMEQTPGKDKRWEFILSHPHSAVSAYLGNQLMRQGYNLTVQEVTRQQRAIDSVPADPQRFALFQKNCEYALQTARNHPLVDLELNDLSGNVCQLVDVVPKGKIVLVDFWATWCGPCMAAIPHIKQLAERYPDNFVVVGVSCDKNLEAWKAAIEKEGARWEQYVLTEQGNKDFLEKYQLNGVPYFLLLDKRGRVIANPKHVGEIEEKVEQLCG